MSSFGGFGGMIPQFAGYGGVVPGVSGSGFPKLPGLTSSFNSMGGFSTHVNTGNGSGGVQPWTPPALGGWTGAPTPGSSGAPGTTGTPPGTTGGTPPPAAPGAGGWLGGLIGQITGTPFQPLPNPPNLGLGQTQQNMLAYQQYLQNLANQQNDIRFKQAASALQGAGTTALADAQRSADQQKASINQNMIDRGLNNTTIAPTLNAGVDRQQQYETQRVNEGIAQQLISLLSSKQDEGPNTNLFAQLMQQFSKTPNTSLIPGLSGGITYNTFGPQWSHA